MLNNQGLDKREFRAALGFIRLAESSFTAIAYLTAGLFTTQSNLLIPQILPSVLIGVPIGAALIRQMKVETFRRICMSFDAWVVGFGVSTVLRDTKLVSGRRRICSCSAVILIDVVLLYRFFSGHGGRVDFAQYKLSDNEQVICPQRVWSAACACCCACTRTIDGPAPRSALLPDVN